MATRPTADGPVRRRAGGVPGHRDRAVRVACPEGLSGGRGAAPRRAARLLSCTGPRAGVAARHPTGRHTRAGTARVLPTTSPSPPSGTSVSAGCARRSEGPCRACRLGRRPSTSSNRAAHGAHPERGAADHPLARRAASPSIGCRCPSSRRHPMYAPAQPVRRRPRARRGFAGGRGTRAILPLRRTRTRCPWSGPAPMS